MRPATCNSSRTATSPRVGAVASAVKGEVRCLCHASLSHEAKQPFGREAKRCAAKVNRFSTNRRALIVPVLTGGGWCRLTGAVSAANVRAGYVARR
ncbi:hypothetical protein SAM23877_1835 [Streptomyces ambofaciens ATCC 23877]|uniref:Uncharacterized protein n=1 Tax=Streptomyces ambofaciens (strain ATCC 23877 / 3486 / DSM 40053 / JCM 4204 / NBRC 12836 / NRRL B-2516) TaxID=278992 RepID=A0A0K2APH5_STRA7|nr:hypothetical protein SAM23877_1835 [Streptomyces ambofaciens ATCC 23877]